MHSTLEVDKDHKCMVNIWAISVINKLYELAPLRAVETFKTENGSCCEISDNKTSSVTLNKPAINAG